MNLLSLFPLFLCGVWAASEAEKVSGEPTLVAEQVVSPALSSSPASVLSSMFVAPASEAEKVSASASASVSDASESASVNEVVRSTPKISLTLGGGPRGSVSHSFSTMLILPGQTVTSSVGDRDGRQGVAFERKAGKRPEQIVQKEVQKENPRESRKRKSGIRPNLYLPGMGLYRDVSGRTSSGQEEEEEERGNMAR